MRSILSRPKHRELARRTVAWLVVAAATACTPFRPAPGDLTAPVLSPGAVRVYVAGDIADCGSAKAEDAAAARTSQLVPVGATVLGLGDMTYPRATTATLQSCYEPTWGRHLPHTLAVAGNHDYVDGDSRDFRRYFGLDGVAVSTEFVAYARQLSPDWLLIALDSNVTGAAMERQVAWLEQTLEQARPRATTAATAAGSTSCLAVMWHTPVQSSGLHHGSGDRMRSSWRLVDQYDADLVLNGHEHFYEAFDPVDGAGNSRLDDGDGVRQFTVGTGGARLYGFWRPPYSSRARVLSHGVLEMTLEPGRYAWRFLDVDGRVRDAGRADCRGRVARGN